MLKKVIYSWERKLARRDNNRVVRPFEWGLEFLHRDDFASDLALDASKEATANRLQAIYEFNRMAIRESHAFFSAPPVTGFSLDGGWLTFPSALPSPYAE